MKTNRLEAFSDGVIAIIITIMVLELRPPEHSSLHDLVPVVPKLISYLLSFIFVGIYWNNHHHVFHAAQHVSGTALWANMHLLFWLSLVPFATAWVGEHHVESTPCALYGVVLLGSGFAYALLVRALVAVDGKRSVLARAIGPDRKGWLSILLYGVAIPLCYLNPWIGVAIYATVAVIWFVPDRRIEQELDDAESDEDVDAGTAPGKPSSATRIAHAELI